jgi:hypothetical protein
MAATSQSNQASASGHALLPLPEDVHGEVPRALEEVDAVVEPVRREHEHRRVEGDR